MKSKIGVITISLVITILSSLIIGGFINEKDTAAETLSVQETENVHESDVDKEESVAYIEKNQLKEDVRFVLEDTHIKSTPKKFSRELQSLPQGTTVRVLDDYDELWSYVEIILPWAQDADNKGWIEKKNLGDMEMLLSQRKSEKNISEKEIYKDITVKIKNGAKELDHNGKEIFSYEEGQFGRIFNIDSVNGKKIYDLEIINGSFIRTSEEFVEFLS